ncbi:MAG: hypothetical protein AB7J35_21695 [Dehalococcoidia bacterium]
MAAINHPLGRPRHSLPIPIPGTSRLNLWLILSIIAAGVCSLLPVLQNSLATSRGFDIQATQAQETQLEGQISLLEGDVASLTSMARIERRAQEIGLRPVTDPIYVSVNEPGPAPAKLPSEYLPKAEPSPVSPSPWWKSLIHWLP